MGSHDISLRTLAAEGVVLLGRAHRTQDATIFFASDLAANIEWGDQQAFDFLRVIDGKVLAEGFDAPEQKVGAHTQLAEALAAKALAELDLTRAGVGAVIWATGYRPNFGWVNAPILAEDGYPIHRRGVTAVRGLYILGLDWLYKLKSGLFVGVGEDAEYLSGVIAAHAASAHDPSEFEGAG